MSEQLDAYPHDPEYLGSKVPPKDATLRAPVGGPVTIRWDRWGLAHIHAGRPRDLFFGLGYATAQECLWRLDYTRRLARGELAAVLGRDALASDRTMRLLGLGRNADETARALPEPTAEALEGLAAGINHWIAQAVDPPAGRRTKDEGRISGVGMTTSSFVLRPSSGSLLPVEFDWLGYEPAPWTPADSLACWKYRWWTLTGRLENIALGEAARRHLPPELLAPFLAADLGEETIVPPDADASLAPWLSPPASPAVPGGADTGEGSNNWAVAGTRTTTGYPVLCSDPHNPFGQPGQWFQAQLTLADGSLDAIGPIYAGTPGIYLGRNRHLAWGFTNHVASARDLYVETVDAARPGLYLDQGQWRAFDVERVSIDVRGAPPDQLDVYRTVRGPVVNALLPVLQDAHHGDTERLGTGDWRSGNAHASRTPNLQSPVPNHPPVSLRWTGFEVGSGLDAVLGLNRARSVAEALAALEHWVCPVLNCVLADDQGHIAYHAVGRVPRRTEAVRAYRRADEPAHAWQGFLRFDELPQLLDPPRGWIATANQPPWRRDPPGIAYLGSAAWADGGRMRRIRGRLTAQDRLSPDELGAVQADITSARALELIPALLTLVESRGDAGTQGRRDAESPVPASPPSPTPNAQRPTPSPQPPAPGEATAILAAWDCRYTLDTPAPSIWVAFWERWLRRVAAARFPTHLVPLVSGQAGAVASRLLLGQDTSPPWFGARDVREEAGAAFAEALTWLAERCGASLDGWQWGKLHTVTWRHPLSEYGPAAQRQAAADVFDVGPFPTTGGASIVRAAGHSAARPFQVTGGATYRLVADLTPGGGMKATTTTGQSGHPRSPHYADQAPLWLGDAYHPFPMDDFVVEGVTTIVPDE